MYRVRTEEEERATPHERTTTTRIILTTRDADRWYASFRGTLLVMLDPTNTRLARWLDPGGYGRFVPFARRTLEILLGPLDALGESEAKRRYAEYYQQIRRLVPPETKRMLEYDVSAGEGWAPLCAFLGKDVPAVAFPHKNDGKMILEGSRRQMWAIYRRAAVRFVMPAALLVSVLAALYFRR